MGRLERLYRTTERIVEVLNTPYKTSEERTEIVTKVNELIEERGSIVKEIKPPYTDKEEKIGEQIIELDQQIKVKMDQLFKEIQEDLKKLKKKKDSNITYMNPYKNVNTVDGMYLDHKL